MTNMSSKNEKKISKPLLKDELKKLSNLVDNLDSLGIEVGSSKNILEDIANALADDNLETANELLNNAKNETKSIKEQYFFQASSILFSSLKRTIMNLADSDPEKASISEVYRSAKGLFDQGHYEEALKQIKQAEEIAMGLNTEEGDGGKLKNLFFNNLDLETEEESEGDRSQAQMERVSLILIRVEKLIEEAKEAGYVVNNILKLYSLAEDAFDNQDYIKAEEYGIDCEDMLNDSLAPLHAATEKSKDITITTTATTTATTTTTTGSESSKSAQKEIDKYREDLPTSIGLYPVKKYSDMAPMGLVGDTKEDTADEGGSEDPSVNDLENTDNNKESEIENEATQQLILFDKRINTAKDMDLNVPMAERLFSIAEGYFDRSEFGSVKEYVDKGLKSLDVALAQNQKVKNSDGEINSSDLEAGTVEPDGSGIGESPLPEPEIDPKLELKKKKKLRSRLKKIEVEINKLEDMGISVGNANKLLLHSFEELDRNDLDAAKKFKNRAKRKIKKTKDEFFKQKALEMIKAAWTQMGSMELDSTIRDQANALLDEARNQVKQEEFKKAAEFAIRSVQLIQEHL